MSNIRSSRSQIEARQRCPRSRYLGYHRDQTGLEKPGSKYEAHFGTLIHGVLAAALLLQRCPDLALEVECTKLAQSIDTVFFSHLPPDQRQHLQQEQTWLLRVLVHGWCRYRMPAILAAYEVVEVETEQTVVFDPKDYLAPDFAYIQRPLELPLRRDALLRRKADQMLFIMDWKTTTNPSDDWQKMLDHSLQSYLYIEGTERLSGEYVGGIFYEGLVKGYRQMDGAKSSQWNGQVIQYGTFLYGWVDRNGVVTKEYSKGRQRAFTPQAFTHDQVNEYIRYVNSLGWKLSELFPSTLPWRPLGMAKIVGQTIVNENVFQNNIEWYESMPQGSPERGWYEDILFEQNLASCYKFGTRHGCPFTDICHDGIHEEEIKVMYTPRVDHHGDKQD